VISLMIFIDFHSVLCYNFPEISEYIYGVGEPIFGVNLAFARGATWAS